MTVSVGREGAQLCPSCALGGMGASSQRADHPPGLLQPTGLVDDTKLQKKGRPPRFRRGQRLVQLVP